MNVNQAALNHQYQEILNKLFGDEITLVNKYHNPKTVINHYCKTCRKTFFARPQWLVSGKQPHECYFSTSASPSDKKKAKKVTGSKKGNNMQKKVTEAMKAEMIQLYEEGNSLKSIGRRFSVTPPTVKKYVQQKMN